MKLYRTMYRKNERVKTTNSEQGEEKTEKTKHEELLKLYRHVKPLPKHQKNDLQTKNQPHAYES